MCSFPGHDRAPGCGVLLGSSRAQGTHRAAAGSLVYDRRTEIHRVEAAWPGVTSGNPPPAPGSLLCRLPTAHSCLLHPYLATNLCFLESAEPLIWGVSLSYGVISAQV